MAQTALNDRRRYDATRTPAEFAAVARGETDLAALAHWLTAVVDQALQPEDVELWPKR